MWALRSLFSCTGAASLTLLAICVSSVALSSGTIGSTQQMREQGRSAKDQIEEAVMAMLAPSDGPAMSDNPPEPLALKEREAIWRRLEAKEAGRQRLHAVKSQRNSPQT